MMRIRQNKHEYSFVPERTIRSSSISKPSRIHGSKCEKSHLSTFCKKCCKICLISFVISLVSLLLFVIIWINKYNVHTSQSYVDSISYLEPNAFIINEGNCEWMNENNTRFGNKTWSSHPNVNELSLASTFLEELYRQYGILSIIRHGSLLHRYRGIKGDDDMDIYMIIP